jgi:hypothetical protein
MGANEGYCDAQFAVTQKINYPGNGGTTFLFTPAVGTLTYTQTGSAQLSTGTVVGESIGFYEPVKIRQIIYTIKTAAASGNSANLYVYIDGTVAGTLAVSATASASCVLAADVNVQCAAQKVVRVTAVSITTGTNATPSGASVGFVQLKYQEMFDGA